MSNRMLFLDDSPERKTPDGWDRVWSYADFVEYISFYGVPKYISFDHDLGFEHYPLGEQNPGAKIPYSVYKEKTGYHAALYLVEHDMFPEVAIVHSFNVVGAKNIIDLLGRYCDVLRVPYGHHCPLYNEKTNG